MTGGIRPMYRGRTVLVVGAARSGVAAAEFLLASGARVVLTDIKSEESLAVPLDSLKNLAKTSGELTLELGGHHAESFRAADFVLVSPGVPMALPCIEESRLAGIPVLAEVELAYRHLRGKIVAITGSNGKTTTTTLVAELLSSAGLRAFAAGNIGRALISFAAGSQADDIYVVELSSFQLEGILRFRPLVGAVLNLTPDHMDRYPGFAEYVRAKARIFENQTAADFAVLNADDPRTAAMRTGIVSTPFLFSRRGEVECGTMIRDGRIVYRDERGEKDLFGVDDIRLRGSHNLENVLAASAMALLAGAPPEALGHGVRSFQGVEHRLEWVADHDGVQYFNDSKATNVDAAIQSLLAFARGIIWIAGGRDKGADFAPLRPLVAGRVKHLIVLGEAAGKIREALGDLVETTAAATHPEAVTLAGHRAAAGDIVLLAPACASFDMFVDYEHRGRVFKEAVRGFAGENVKG
jgi:UDP-N-acetylmuramoylalanine--D-glutamate ligase